MKLWWMVAHPIYVITEDNEDLSDLQMTSVIGSYDNEYQEPMYQLKHTESEKELVKSQSADLNCTIQHGHNGPVIYKRLGDDIFRKGDKPYVVAEKTYCATPGNDDLWPRGVVVKIGDIISAETYSNGTIKRQLA